MPEIEHRFIIQLLRFWTSSIDLFLCKNNVSETEFCLRLQVEPTQMGQIDRASPCLRTPVILSPFSGGTYSDSE
jgi:hypothetical protein